MTKNNEGNNAIKENGAFGGIYELAFIGASVYFIQHAATFWDGVLGVIKTVF